MANKAQQLHATLGVPVREEHKQAHGDKNASATKSGNGRYHAHGHSKASPRKNKGAPRGFVLHTNSLRNAARKAKAALGHRQIKRARMAPLRDGVSEQTA